MAIRSNKKADFPLLFVDPIEDMRKRNNIIIIFVLLSMLCSCSIIRGWRKDGAAGPGTFSYQERLCDTIKTDSEPFKFAVLPASDRTLDTLHIYKMKDADTLLTITERMRPLSPNQSIVIIRNDTIIYEKSFGNYTPLTNATIFSVSKSVTSLLCGIAIDEEYIKSIDDPVTDYLPELKKRHPYWQRLTIRHLLNMQSGIDMDDTYSLSLKGWGKLKKMAQLEYGKDVMKLIQGLKFAHLPGEKYHYRSIDTQVLGLVIERATCQTFAQYLSEKVWKPLCMESDAYVTIDSQKAHHTHTFGGIATNVMDLAKIGRLYLNRGMWNGRRVVSEEWIKASIDYDTSNDGYHLCWYNTSNIGMEKPDYPGVFAVGIRGQVLYINPAKNLIMVRLGNNNYQYLDPSWIFEMIAQDL